MRLGSGTQHTHGLSWLAKEVSLVSLQKNPIIIIMTGIKDKHLILVLLHRGLKRKKGVIYHLIFLKNIVKYI